MRYEYLACLWFAIAASACRTPQVDATLTAAPLTDVQCDPKAGFRGICTVTDISGRQETSTDAARESELASIKEIQLSITGQNQQTTIAFLRKTGPIDEWGIERALDLYNRQGCIAEVSGGIFSEGGYTPKLTIRTLLSQHDNSRTGFAELSDYRTTKPLHVTLGMKCDWQR